MTTVSKDGQDWLVLALDPFHDLQRPIEGIPDEFSAPSFVRCHLQQAIVSASAEGDQFRITFDGLHGPSNLEMCTWDQGLAGAAGNFSFGHIQCLRSAAGADPSYTAVATSVASFPTTPTADIPSRLVAIGIEVTDITQKLYQQGVIGVCRCTGAHETVDDPIQVPLADKMSMAFSCTRAPALPANRSLAGINPSWVEWAAPKGAYVTPRFNFAAKPASFVVGSATSSYSCHPCEVREATGEGAVTRFVTRHVHAGNVVWDPTTLLQAGAVDSGFDPVAIFIGGVDVNAQFRITVRTYVEYFPEVNNATAMASATPSPAFDPLAFASYHSSAMKLPIGVPVEMNAKGDWWRMVKDTFRGAGRIAYAAAPSLLTLAGQPELAAAVSAAQAASRALARNPAKSLPAMREPRVNRRAPAKR